MEEMVTHPPENDKREEYPSREGRLIADAIWRAVYGEEPPALPAAREGRS